MYNPLFQVTSETIRHLGKIEASREILEGLDIPLFLEKTFRQEAFAKITHYSTKIEGNRLTLKQTKELLSGIDVVAREKDKREVMNYYECLEFIHKASQSKEFITEKLIKKMHAVIQKGIVKGKLKGEYREAQNAIYDAKTRKAVYLPPEATDIGPLMQSFLKWLNQERELHPVLKAGITHYQFVTLHPFMDGNGRTARALATLLLYREKYDLKQFYSLEEYYAEDLKGYYDTLHQCQGFNYYHNPNPDITPWINYFVKGVAIIFEELKEKVLSKISKPLVQKNKRELELLQAVGPREKKVLHFFRHHLQLRTKQLSTLFNIKDRTARNLLTQWIEKDFIRKQGSGKRNAYYVLSEDYRQLIGGFKETTVFRENK